MKRDLSHRPKTIYNLFWSYVIITSIYLAAINFATVMALVGMRIGDSIVTLSSTEMGFLSLVITVIGQGFAMSKLLRVLV